MGKLNLVLEALAGMPTTGVTTASAQDLNGGDPIEIFASMPASAHAGRIPSASCFVQPSRVEAVHE